MRFQSSLISALLLSATAINASSILPKVPEVKIEPISPILYPHGQDPLGPSFLFGLSYLGGAGGQMARRVATSGVVGTRTATQPASGSIISAPTQWMSGFEIDFCGSSSGQGSNSFGITYSLLTGNSNTSTTNGSTTTPNILPSFSTNYSTGNTTLMSSVSSQYNMPSLQDGLFTYSRSLFVNPYLSVMVLTGLHGLSLNHKMNVSYVDLASGVTSLYMKEVTYGLGPLVGFTSTKKLSTGFALRGTFFASAPLCNHSLTQSDSFLNIFTGATTYGYNANSANQLRQHFVGHLDLEAVFRSEFVNFSAFEFILGWHVKQYVNLSYLTSMSNNQNAAPSSIQVDTLKIGLLFIF